MDTLGSGRGSFGIRGHTLATTGVVSALILAVSAEICYSVCCDIFVWSFGMWYVPSCWKYGLTASALPPCSTDLALLSYHGYP